MDPPSTHSAERSLNRQVVLEEDEYTAALSRIIARDFFPSLVHLDATNSYLDALNSRDPHLINASVRRLEQISNTPKPPYQTPAETPYSMNPSDTPRHVLDDSRPNKRPKLAEDLSLDAFQARYTSEDNSSFTQILDEENRKRKEKWAWAWDAQKRVEGQRDRMIEAREKMLIEAPPVTGVREKFMIEHPVPAGFLTDGKEDDENAKEGAVEKSGVGVENSDNRVAIVSPHIEEEESQIDVMAPKKDTRSAAVDGWRFKARNSLMFSPDADDSPYRPTLDRADGSGDPKYVKYDGTRLPDQDHSSHSRSSSAPPSPTRSRIDAAIFGTPYHPKSPRENSFSLVPNLPSPTAAELGPTAVKQLMTWGTLNATPRIISQSDVPEGLPPPTTPFHIPAMSSREMISHKLSNNASKSLRNKAGLMGLGQIGRTPGIGVSKTPSTRKGNMAPPVWTPRRSEAAGSLTPAARRLLERSTMGTSATRRAQAMEQSDGWGNGTRAKEKDLNRMRWTPTPGRVSRP